MTDPDLARRAAALGARSDTTARPGRKRRHPAGVSRIVVAGLSGTALFSLIAALTLTAPAPTRAVSAPTVATRVVPSPQTVIVIHRTVVVPATAGPPAPSGVAATAPSRSTGAPTRASAPAVSASPAPAAVAAAPAVASTPAPVPRPVPVTTTKTS